jgi:hypothetical protein
MTRDTSESEDATVRGGISRRSVVLGLGIAALYGFATFSSWSNDQPSPSSSLVSTNATVYDEYADICGIDLVVNVAPSERVVIENDLPGGSDRTVQNSGQRFLKTVVPADSTVLIYAVNLNENTSKRLKSYRITNDCTLSEVKDRAE